VPHAEIIEAGGTWLRIHARRVLADGDVENSLRTAVLEFADTVRSAEKAIATARRGGSVPDEFDVTPLSEITEEEWRTHWPAGAPVLKASSKKRKGRR